MDDKRFLDPSGASEAADKFGSPALEDEKIEAVPKVMSTPESDASIRNSSGASTPQNMFTEDDDVTADQLNGPKLPRKNPSTTARSSEDVASEPEEMTELRERLRRITQDLDIRTTQLINVRVEQVNTEARLYDTEARLYELQRDLEDRDKELDEINRLLGEEKRKNTKLEHENKDLWQQCDEAYVKLEEAKQELNLYLIDRSTSDRYLLVEESGKPRFNVDARGDALSCGFHFGRRMALWVQEYIGKDEENASDRNEMLTKGKFKCDHEVHNCLTDDDYKDLNERMFKIHKINCMYDRGHMAREGNYRLSTHRKETCRYSNICPQHHGLNHGAWLRLENVVLKWAKECDPGLWVCCGPMWIGSCTLTIGKDANAVPVPSHYYKVVLLEKGDKKEIRAFKFPNESIIAHGDMELFRNYQVHVEEVECYLGAEFFPNVERPGLSVSDILQ